MIKNFLSIQDLSQKLNVKISWLYSRTRTKEIPHYKLGKYVRFDEAEIMEWIKERKEELI